jgi:hypothetical protein
VKAFDLYWAAAFNIFHDLWKLVECVLSNLSLYVYIVLKVFRVVPANISDSCIVQARVL